MNDLLSSLNPFVIFTSLRDFVETGGPVLLWIMGITFLMWTMILERFWYFLATYPATSKKVLSLWEARPDKSSWHAHQIRTQLISQVNLESNHSLGTIKTLVALAPFFGLLGTVTGMVEVFDVMAATGASNARAMASGVSKATIPTMAGMVAAISGLYFSTLLERRAKRSTQKIEDALEIHFPEDRDKWVGRTGGARRKREQAEEDEGTVDLTPMLDIVFIMLIFFIVTAVFVRETGVEVVRPDAETDQEKANISVLVAVDADSRVFIDGREIEVRAVRTQVERLRTDNPKGPVIIQADEEADTGIVVQVMDQARLAGAPSVTVATKQE